MFIELDIGSQDQWIVSQNYPWSILIQNGSPVTSFLFLIILETSDDPFEFQFNFFQGLRTSISISKISNLLIFL